MYSTDIMIVAKCVYQHIPIYVLSNAPPKTVSMRKLPIIVKHPACASYS